MCVLSRSWIRGSEGLDVVHRCSFRLCQKSRSPLSLDALPELCSCYSSSKHTLLPLRLHRTDTLPSPAWTCPRSHRPSRRPPGSQRQKRTSWRSFEVGPTLPPAAIAPSQASLALAPGTQADYILLVVPRLSAAALSITTLYKSSLSTSKVRLVAPTHDRADTPPGSALVPPPTAPCVAPISDFPPIPPSNSAPTQQATQPACRTSSK